jgi:hypothetical protein
MRTHEALQRLKEILASQADGSEGPRASRAKPRIAGPLTVRVEGGSGGWPCPICGHWVDAGVVTVTHTDGRQAVVGPQTWHDIEAGHQSIELPELSRILESIDSPLSNDASS